MWMLKSPVCNVQSTNNGYSSSGSMLEAESDQRAEAEVDAVVMEVIADTGVLADDEAI